MAPTACTSEALEKREAAEPRSGKAAASSPCMQGLHSLPALRDGASGNALLGIFFPPLPSTSSCLPLSDPPPGMSPFSRALARFFQAPATRPRTSLGVTLSRSCAASHQAAIWPYARQRGMARKSISVTQSSFAQNPPPARPRLRQAYCPYAPNSTDAPSERWPSLGLGFMVYGVSGLDMRVRRAGLRGTAKDRGGEEQERAEDTTRQKKTCIATATRHRNT